MVFSSENFTSIESNVLGEATISTDNISKKKEILNNFYRDLEKKVSQTKLLAADVNRLLIFLKKQKSPIATYAYAEQIVKLAKENKADYKIITVIMGVESGFCSANYLKYNCFGYLNKVQYSSFNQAFTRLIPRISKEYANVYKTDFVKLAKAYGVVNYDFHAAKMESWYKKI